MTVAVVERATPGTPIPTINRERTLHRQVRARYTREWRGAFKQLALEQRIPQLQSCVIEVDVWQPAGALQDVCACVPAAKAAIDGLVDAGVMVDDGPRYLHQVVYNQPQRGPAKLRLTLIGDAA